MITTEERRVIKLLKRALAQVPGSLSLYVLDNSVIVCKDGYSSSDFSETVGHVRDAGAAITDMHDDRNNGLK